MKHKITRYKQAFLSAFLILFSFGSINDGVMDAFFRYPNSPNSLQLFVSQSTSTKYKPSKKRTNKKPKKNKKLAKSKSKSKQNKYYKNGRPKVKRSASTKKKFLKSKGYKKAPKGYEVDHIKPLSQGGKDTISNMQLLSKEQHKKKTAREARKRAKK
jgi:5-methylcytosine-specific restriction endonuclease McrA